MAIPDNQACFLPILQSLADRADHHVRDVTRCVADKFGLTESEREQLLPVDSKPSLQTEWAGQRLI
jgi:restriction endonuclease Mrr